MPDLIWSFSATNEAEHFRQVWRRDERIHIVAEMVLAQDDVTSHANKRPAKALGVANFVFLSRITPMKNLHTAIELLAKLRGEIHFSFYGPIDDDAYWARCQQSLQKLPAWVHAHYGGVIARDQVVETLAAHHFFLLPTFGENFGHAIIEALSAGCPVLISDRTPWRNLAAADAGWDTSLEDEALWLARLQACIDMDMTAYAQISSRAMAYAALQAENSSSLQQNKAVFDLAASLPRKRSMSEPGER
ncbi:MAG: glycosyltransferase [Anaerolineae bacterium]|nr:glycosyltransferase [Anaerolineae bacterium]